MCVYVLNENYCYIIIILIIYYRYIHLSLLFLWNLYGFFLILIGHFSQLYRHMYFHYLCLDIVCG